MTTVHLARTLILVTSIVAVAKAEANRHEQQVSQIVKQAEQIMGPDEYWMSHSFHRLPHEGRTLRDALRNTRDELNPDWFVEVLHVEKGAAITRRATMSVRDAQDGQADVRLSAGDFVFILPEQPDEQAPAIVSFLTRKLVGTYSLEGDAQRRGQYSWSYSFSQDLPITLGQALIAAGVTHEPDWQLAKLSLIRQAEGGEPKEIAAFVLGDAMEMKDGHQPVGWKHGGTRMPLRPGDRIIIRAHRANAPEAIDRPATQPADRQSR